MLRSHLGYQEQEAQCLQSCVGLARIRVANACSNQNFERGLGHCEVPEGNKMFERRCDTFSDPEIF